MTRYYKFSDIFLGFTLLQVDQLMDVDGFRSAMAAPAAPALASVREAWQNMIIWWLNSLLFFLFAIFFVGVWRWLLIGVDTLEVKQATSKRDLMLLQLRDFDSRARHQLIQILVYPPLLPAKNFRAPKFDPYISPSGPSFHQVSARGVAMEGWEAVSAMCLDGLPWPWGAHSSVSTWHQL